MLKTFYNTEAEVPDNLKGAYIAKDGKMVLDDLSADNPIVKKRDHLLTIVASKASNVEELENWVEVHGKATMPKGHKAVPEDVAELGEVAAAAKLTKDDIPKLKTENEELKKKVEERETETVLERAAKAIGITGIEAFKRLPASKALKIEERIENGETKFVVVGEVDGKATRDDLTLEYLEKSDDFKLFMPALTASGSDDDDTEDDTTKSKSGSGTKFVKQNKTPADKSKGKGEDFDKIRKEVEEEQKKKAPANVGTFSDKFNRRAGAAS